METTYNWKKTRKIPNRKKSINYENPFIDDTSVCFSNEADESEECEPQSNILEDGDLESIENTTVRMEDADYDCSNEPRQIISAYNAFNVYLKKYPLLTAEEEKNLSAQIQNGDMEAYHKLVLSNLRLVIACAGQTLRRYGNDSILDYMDIIMEGVTGLLVAALRFDWRKNTRFSTYAVLWICSRIKRAMESQREGFTVPGYTGKSIHVLNDHIKNYLKGKESSIPDELKKRVKELSTVAGPVMIIDNSAEEEENSDVVSPDRISENALEDSDEETVLNDIETIRFQTKFHVILRSLLTDEEYYIFCRRYGAGIYMEYGPAPLKDISEERFRSIEYTRKQMEDIENLLKNNSKIKYLFEEWCTKEEDLLW